MTWSGDGGVHLNCGESVCDHEDGLVLCQFVDGLLHQLLADRIQSRGCFIQEDNWRVLHKTDHYQIKGHGHCFQWATEGYD